jgi:hypothetical protein
MVSHVYSYSYIYFNENRRERHAVIDHFTIVRTSYVYATPEWPNVASWNFVLFMDFRKNSSPVKAAFL